MTKQRLDQLYCTHCTYHTSALHRREGASGEQVFEESTRAGSVPREKSHDVYSRFGSNLLYHVPGDMPAAEMVKHTASSLNLRRLVYLPSVGGYRLLAQVCFRPTDTRGRPGASFSHVLIQDLKEFPEPWTPVDCLKLWGSEKWVIEDKPNLPHDLPPFSDFGEFDPGYKSLISDQLLLNFLKTPVHTDFIDHEKIIPKRWQKLPPEARQKVLVYLLQAVLNLDFDRRESLFIAVEPSMAALLFYGIFRLLPAIGIAEKLSFSTYQSHRDRLMTTLAATCFHDPDATDLPPDWYSPHARGAAYNTFKADRQTPLKKTGQFATSIVARFVSEDRKEGPAAVNEFLTTCAQLGIGRGEELENLSTIDGLVERLTSRQSKEQMTQLERELPRDAGLRAFLRTKLIGKIDHATVSTLLSQPAQCLTVFKLLTEPAAADDGSRIEPIVETMLSRWPDDAVCDLLKDKDVSKARKVEILNRQIKTHKTLPKDVTALFATREPICTRDTLLEEVLLSLRGEPLQQFVKQTYEDFPTEVCFCELLRNLAPLTARAEHSRAFRELFRHPRFRDEAAEKTKMIGAALADKLIRDTVAKTEDFSDETFSGHLTEVLNTLHQIPNKLDQRLELLTELQHLLPIFSQKRIEPWKAVSAQLKELQKLNGVQQSFFKKLFDEQLANDKNQAAKELGFAAKKALQPVPGTQHDPRPSIIVSLVTNVLGGEERLPPQFRDHINSVFATDSWELRGSLRKQNRQRITTKQAWMAGGAFLFLMVVVISAWEFSKPTKSDVEDKNSDKTIANNKKSDGAPKVPTTVVESNDNDKTNPGKKTTRVNKPDVKAEKGDGKPEPEELELTPAQPKAQKEPSVAKVMPAGPDEKSPPTVKPVTQDPTPTKATTDDQNSSINWPTFYKLPGLVLAKSESSKAEPSSKDDIPKETGPETSEMPDPFERFERLQQWSTAKGIELKLVGVKELNSRLQNNGNSRRIHLSIDSSDQLNGGKSIFVYKLTQSERALQETRPTRETLKNSDLICGFELRESGLFFSWAKTDDMDQERISFQTMLKLCGLCVESHKERPIINLIHPDEIFSGKTVGFPAEYATYSFDKKAKTHDGATFQFQSQLEGVDAFQWIVAKGKIANKNDMGADQFELPFQDAQFKLIGNKSQEVGLNDSKLAASWMGTGNIPCDTASFKQVLRPADGQKWTLNITIIPDWDEQKALDLKSRIDEVKPLPSAVEGFIRKLPPYGTTATANSKVYSELKSIVGLVKKWERCCRDDRLLKNPKTEPLSLLSEVITRDPFNLNGVKISDQTTIGELGDGAKSLQAYLNDARNACKKEEIDKASSRAFNEASNARNSNEGMDSNAEKIVARFRAIEIGELRRRIDNRWIPIYVKHRADSKE